ncbi:MAG TPA: ectonucleotide pyrophosphatase/phosphodiesterase [Vicinamibacterales bacterium]|nr:ectonucleotide pyrophosphatase/phosphodiesterase [Vicinamibacterales bacterium]
MFHRLARLGAAVFAAALLVACRTAALPQVTAERPIVVLVSIDGFRWDYLEKFRPPTLLALAAGGVRAEGLIPQFPSKTFPNHYTIATGLRIARHGIVSNNMEAPDIPGRFSLRNRDVLMDPRWWGGEPIWNTVERQGLVASAMFWPGSETKIGGRQATYWIPYEEEMPHAERVARTLDWLTRPAGKGASFATLYFSDVDTAGHRRGPDSEEVRDAVARVDASLAQLVKGVEDAGRGARVHYIVVSDHGMASLSPDRMIVLDDLIDIATAEVIDWSPVLGLTPRDGDVARLYAALKDRHPALAVYRKGEVPAKYGLAGHPRLPPIVGIAGEGWHVTSRAEMARWGTGNLVAPGGNHGYDPQLRSMHGLFVAAGSRVHRGRRVPAFENIHLYELMCALLGVRPAKNDGDLRVTRGILRERAAQ